MATNLHPVKKLLLTLSVVVVCMAPISAIATSPGRVPPEKTRWFNIESITVDVPADLPAEGFEVRPASSSPYLELRHTGKNPIFLQIEDASDYSGNIVGVPDYKKDDYYSDTEIPNILQYPSIPNYKLVKGKVFRYRGNHPGESKINYESMNQNDGWLKIHVKEMDPKINEAWKSGDGRPTDVKVPESILLKHQILYWTHHDGQFYDVSGKVDFALNESYESTAKQDAIDAATREHMDMLRDDMVLPNTLIMIVELFIGLAMVIFSWLPFV